MDSDTIISINNIDKRYGGIHALNSVSFDIRRGEILGLLGANGAGTSTLLKILGGIIKPDSGYISYEGSPLKADTPHASQKLGLVSVYQELNVFLNMTVAENLFLGFEPKRKHGLIDHKLMISQADKVLSEFNVDIPPRTLLQQLSIAQRHMVEIVRALNENPKVLMLDEPTAALSHDQIQWLFEKIRVLSAIGVSVIYVSHRLDEVVRLCDRCVILKDGAFIDDLAGDFSKEQIIAAMIGRSIDQEKRKADRNIGEPVISVKDISIKGKLHDISFDIGAGEILGIGGLMGAGRSELLRAIYGIDTKDGGTISLHGQKLVIKHPNDAINNKIVLIGEDRKKDGLFLPQSIVNNISASSIRKWSRYGFINRKQEVSVTKEVSKSVTLDPGRALEAVDTLSGGNQQKAVLAKALLTGSKVILLDEPTRGVDVGAREDIYRLVRELAEDGKGILLVSSDWEELIALSDRVIVISEGKVTSELKGEEIIEENLMHWATAANIAGESSAVKRKSLLRKVQEAVLYSGNNIVTFSVFLMLLIIAGTLILPNFLTMANFRNILSQSFLLILFTLGQIFVIVQGKADISMSATMTVSGLLGLTIMQSGTNMLIPGVLAMLCFGVFIGVVISMLVVIGRMNSMIATYGVSMMLSGIALIITPRAITPTPDILRELVRESFLGLPLTLYIGAVFVAVIVVLFKYTSLGRHMFAVGENATAALWSGLKVKTTMFVSFIICSVMGTVGALFMLGRTGGAEPVVSIGANLDAIAYALIGGGSFAGGKGSVGGSVIAIFCVITLMSILNALEVGIHQRDVVRGVLLVGIIILNELKASKQRQTHYFT